MTKELGAKLRATEYDDLDACIAANVIEALQARVQELENSWHNKSHLKAIAELAAVRGKTLEEAANVAAAIYQTHRDLYKGRIEPLDKEHWYNPHTDGIADGAGMAEDAIRALKEKV